MASEYERLRASNLAENRRVLAELGLIGPFRKPFVPVSTEKKRPKKKPVHQINSNDLSEDNDENSFVERTKSRRRSRRLLGKFPEDSSTLVLDEDDDDEKSYTPSKLISKNRENVFGAIPGVPVGTVFESRLECSRSLIHRPTVAGIHGNEFEGCYSLALSGGYEDDLDLGECFTYTGEGGRDLKGTKSNPKNLRTAAQSKDQTLTRGNLALTKNVENKKPVRVIRGYKLRSPYAPEHGYRYDGLYTVEKYWPAQGLAGFLVYKYVLKRCEDQETTPWSGNDNVDMKDKMIEDQTLDTTAEHNPENPLNCNIVSDQKSE